MKSLDERVHDAGVRKLNDRLVAKDYYDIVFKHCHYFNDKTGAGELDVVAIKNQTLIYYEVKGYYNKQSRHKAREQYRRVCEAFPNMTIKGVYYCLDKQKAQRLW